MHPDVHVRDIVALMGDADVPAGGHEAVGFRIPIHEVLGVYEVSRGGGQAVMAFDVDPDVHLGALIVHGGMAPLLMDACAGMAVMSQIIGQGYVRATINLTCNYLRPILGGHVEARCEIVHITKRHAHVSGEVYADDVLCATGNITLVLAPGEFPGADALRAVDGRAQISY